MASQETVEGSVSHNAPDGSYESTVELNVKTLDSQSHSFRVDKNMTVSAFKDKIATQIGVPVGQQRLIFRGKVLKDEDLLSEYHVENGDTLHLVERQPSQSQPSSSDGSEGSNTNNGNRDFTTSGQDPSAGGPLNRAGQISHSVVLGTVNVGDQGDGIVPDLNRVIGAVLNSVGIANPQPGVQFNNTQGPTPHISEREGTTATTGNQSEDGNQPLHGSPFPHVVQIPVGAAMAMPSANAPIPNSLHTLLEFINRMEQTFAQNDRSDQSPSGGMSTDELPLNSRGVATPEGLSIVLRQAERLFGGSAVAALSHIARRLEQEAGSTDSTVRGQIQTESMQLGLAIQHLGALFLELGRTILTLHMGQSPAESFVNAGPAVYISHAGPNPIMVQPFPLQTSSLWGAPTTTSSGVFGPIGVGNIPRHVNIHIHTAVPRANNGEGSQGEHGFQSGAGGRNFDDQQASADQSRVSSRQMYENTRMGEDQRRNWLSKSEHGESASSTSNEEESRRIGQRVLGSFSSFPNSRTADLMSLSIPPRSARGFMGQNSGDQLDVANAMSEMLHSPALDGLLTGVSRQTGIGSPDVLRNMMEQLTQSPAMRNTVNQMAQQMDSHDLGRLSGRPGNQDLSRMIQQMMPIVSQALGGGGATHPQSTLGMGSELRQSRSMRDFVRGPSQVDLRQVAQRIENQSPPREIFRAVVENAARLYTNAGGSGNIVNEICKEDVLANEFMQMLHEDISRRLGGSD